MDVANCYHTPLALPSIYSQNMKFLVLFLSCAACCMASSSQLPDLQCNMCRSVIGDSIDVNRNRDQTVISLINGCKKLQSDLSSTCVAQVQAHAAGFDMETACTDLKLCHASPPNFVCETCKTLIEYDFKKLKPNATQKEVLDAIETFVCDKLPFGVADCKSALESSGPQIYKAFLSNNPKEICDLIHLCREMHLDKILCNECTTAYKKFETMFENNLKLLLAATNKQVCTNLPETERNDCVFLASLFEEHVLSKVGGQAREKCASVGLCRSN